MKYKYMKVKFTKGENGSGYMEIDSAGSCRRVTDLDGNAANPKEYHISDIDPDQPDWALEEVQEVFE